MDVGAQEVISTIINAIVLAVQWLLFRYLKVNKVTVGKSQEEGMSAIADNLNKMYQTFSIALSARGIDPETGAPLTPGDRELNLTEQERTRLAAIRKAEMFRKARGGR